MPRGANKSTLRRYSLIESCRRAPLAMRPCDRCQSRGLECRTSLWSDKCGEYIRVSHPWSLVVTPQQFAALDAQLEKIDAELHRAREAKLEARSRARRLKAQRQKLLEKRSEMTNRELRNIEELEVDEMLAELQPLPTSPTGFSQVSFGSLDRTSLVLTGSS